MSRRVCAALAIVGMLALTASLWISASAGGPADRDVAADVSTTMQTVQVEAIVPRVAGDNASDRVGAERTLRSGLVLFAVLATLLWAASSDRRDAARDRVRRRWAGSGPSPISGRAPPFFASSNA